MILFIDTSGVEARVALFDDGQMVQEKRFVLDEQLSELLLQHIDTLLQEAGFLAKDIQGIVCVKGPGHFTSIRLGVTTANTLAAGWNVPIVGVALGEEQGGLKRLAGGENDNVVAPEYTQEPDIRP